MEDILEIELQKILEIFNGLNGDKSKYCEVFNRIAEQYTPLQVKSICKNLPENIVEFLAKNSVLYKDIMTGNKFEENTIIGPLNSKKEN